mgnify:CR=1 FL=1
MAQIDKPSEYFSPDIWDGNSGTQTISAGGQRDFVWFKQRNGTRVHRIQDILRGVTKTLMTSFNSAEGTETTMITNFNSSGYTTGNDADINTSGNTYVGWSWSANGAGISNTAGSITSTVSANTTSGFSIVSYTGNGSASATIGHGLGTSNVGMIITKNRDQPDGWIVYHKSLGANNYLVLQTTDPSGGSANKYLSVPTPTTYEIGNSGDMNTNTEAYIAYCFADVKGYSKMGKYIGNGSTNGTFVYTGFKPAWLMVKRTDTGDGWTIVDNKRNTYNLVTQRLKAEASDAESALDLIDFTSNGFKNRNNYVSWNASGGTYIYMAFAEQPFVTSTANGSIPATAR